MRFRTVVKQSGKSATGIEVPAEVVEKLGFGKRPPVRMTVNDYSYRSTVAVMGGAYMVSLSAEHRRAAGVARGDEVDVDVELDTEPRVVTVPADLAAALDGDPDARRHFDGLAYSHQLRHVLAIEEAKTPETRARRVSKAVEMLRGGPR